MSRSVASRLRLLAVVGVVAVVATACWRPADLDGQGVPGGNGRTNDALDSSANSAIPYNGAVGVITSVDPVTHRLRLGIDTTGLPTGGTWNFQDLDGPGVAGAGRTSDDIGLDVAAVQQLGKLGGAHIYYSHDGVLREATTVDAISWTFTDLDGPGVSGGNGRTDSTVSGPTSAVVEGLGADGPIHVFYIRRVGPLNQYVLRHAWNDGTWHFEDLDEPYIGRYGSAVWTAGVLHYFSWHEGGAGGRLRHAWFDGAWHFEDLDGPGVAGGGGRTTELTGSIDHAVVWNGQVHVFYSRHGAPAPFNQLSVLRHAWFDGAWHFEDVDGPGVPGGNGRTSDFVATSFGSQAAGVIPTNNELHILYQRQSSPPGLRDAWLDATGWHFGDVDGVAATSSPGHVSADVGTSAAVAFFGGQLHVFSFDRTNHRLRWACATGGNAAAPASCI